LEQVKEFSPSEYAEAGSLFIGERRYHAQDIAVEGRYWSVVIGAVHGKIYKIAAFLELSNKRDANETASGMLTFCMYWLGEPVERKTGLFLWDTTDGNVVLQTADIANTFAINIFLTSRSVRGFQQM
jgi:hypothetical protein